MGKYRDLTGQKFGRLTAIKDAGRTKNMQVLWLCKCDCGGMTVTQGAHLTSGHTKSCGCLHKEKIRTNNEKHGVLKNLYGKLPRIYRIWARMKQRCMDPKVKEYYRYGGRGISVCKEWLEFEPFYKWAMANGYRDDLTIDRINNDGNYEPGNCRWVTYQEQVINSTSSKLITYKGETKNIKNWAKTLGIPYTALMHRIRKGWSIERAFTQPIRRVNRERGSLKKTISS